MPSQPAPSAAVEEPRRELKQIEERIRRQRRRRPKPSPMSESIEVGDFVEVASLGMDGEVLGFDETGEEAEIQVGAFKVHQPVALLKRKRQVRPKRETSRMVVMPPVPSVPNEIHIRGMRAEQALRDLHEYLDDAALASLPWVRIVHGKGTGTLRQIVHDVLKSHPAIDRFEIAPADEGGDGVTIAYFRS